MKKQMKETRLGQAALIGVLAGFLVLLPGIYAFAEELDGVAGCNAVTVDPSASLEDQQAVCSHAESLATSSCSGSGHGMCSSPKTNDTLVEGTHCLCLAEEVAV